MAVTAQATARFTRPDMRRLIADKGTVLYHQGDPANHWYTVQSGVIRLSRVTQSGQRQLTGFAFGGEVFGTETDARDETAEALSPAIVERHAFSPDISAEIVLHPVRKALENARRCIFLLGHRNAEQRLAAFLIDAAERTSSYRTLDLPMNRADIADHLGLTIYTVSRTFSNFARDNLIRIDGRRSIRLLDLAGLRALADADY